MRSQEPGKISNNLWYLGVKESGVYLLRGGNGAALINGGMSYILPEILTQMREFAIDPADISKILILHSHFDHVGVVPYFKRNFPAVQVLASEVAIKTFEKPKAIDFINMYSRMSAGQRSESLEGLDLEWRDDIEIVPVRDGDRIELGGTALEIYETPGHSNCSICAYEQDEGILFASDAVGIPFADKLCPSMNTNMEEYLNSLERLKSLKINILCADHYGYITGEEAGTVVPDSIKEALRMKDLLIETFKLNPDIDAAARLITASFYEEMPDYFLAPEILEGVFKQMLKYIAKTSGEQSWH